MKRASFWARPGFLWAMSIIVPLAVVPAVLAQEALSGWVPGDSGGGDAGAVDTATFGAGEMALLVAWFVVPPLYAALHLWRYRGGATFLPLFGRGWFSGSLSLLSLLSTALFLLAGAVGTELPAPHGIPFALWFALVAFYCQMLRAAAVARSLPNAAQSPEELTRVFE